MQTPNSNPSLFDMQGYCERQGYRCSGRMEGKKFRILLLVNEKLAKEGDLIDPVQVPEKMAEKYTAIYNYLLVKEYEKEY